MEEIAKQLSPFIKKIYDNEKAFFEFLKLDASVLNRVSFDDEKLHVVWRSRVGGMVQTYIVSFTRLQEFFDTLENKQ